MRVAISNDGERAFYAQFPAVKRLAWLTWAVPQSDSGSWLGLLTRCLFSTPHMGMEKEMRSVLKISTGSMRPPSFSAEIQWGHGNIHYLEICLRVTIRGIGEQIQSCKLPKGSKRHNTGDTELPLLQRNKVLPVYEAAKKEKVLFCVCVTRDTFWCPFLPLSSSSSAPRNKWTF